TIDQIRQVKTLDFVQEKRIDMPVGIAELGIPGVRQPAPPAQLSSQCYSDLVSLDGKPLPVRITGSTATAASPGPLSVSLCDPSGATHLSAGNHVLRTNPGVDQGFDIDGVVLSSAAGGTAAPVAALTAARTTARNAGGPSSAPPAMKVVKQGRTSMTVKV